MVNDKDLAKCILVAIQIGSRAVPASDDPFNPAVWKSVAECIEPVSKSKKRAEFAALDLQRKYNKSKGLEESPKIDKAITERL